MNPRAPQQPGTPQLQPDRPNPWGGAVAAPQMQPPPQQPLAPAPAPAAPPVSQSPTPPNSPAVHQLQCPHCRSSLTLRHEHIGIDGSCIHCNTPIRAVAYDNGQVAIELITAPAPQPAPVQQSPQEIAVEVEEVAVELHPTVPASPIHQEVAEQAAPSPWQSQPEPAMPEPAQPFPQQQAPEQPLAAAATAPSQTHATPPPQENETPAWAQQSPAPAFQTESENVQQPQAQAQAQPQSQAAPQQSAAPAFPSPNGAMPWANATPQPPVVEQDNFESFEAASPFATPPHLQEQAQAAPEPQQQMAAPANANVSNSGKRLGKTRRKGNFGFLKFVATLIILGGLGYAAFLFAPEEKVNQAKLWVGEFVKPAFEVFGGQSENDYSPGTPAVPNPPLTPSNPATTIPTAPASSITPEPSAPDTPKAPPAAQNSAAPLPPDDPVSEQLRVSVAGDTAIRQFYRAPSTAARLPFLVAPEKSKSSFDAFTTRFEALPTLKAIALQKATLDVATGRWYGIFEVAENENEKLHRWIAIENEKGEFKLDWNLYEQQIDDALPRFLDDPTAATREFRLALRKGGSVIEDNNPWNSEAVEILIQTPFDSQSARSIVLKKTDSEALGLADKINPTSAKIARVEMSWVPSEYDPLSRVPVIARVIGWGAWSNEDDPTIQ